MADLRPPFLEGFQSRLRAEYEWFPQLRVPLRSREVNVGMACFVPNYNPSGPRLMTVTNGDFTSVSTSAGFAHNRRESFAPNGPTLLGWARLSGLTICRTP